MCYVINQPQSRTRLHSEALDTHGMLILGSESAVQMQIYHGTVGEEKDRCTQFFL